MSCSVGRLCAFLLAGAMVGTSTGAASCASDDGDVATPVPAAVDPPHEPPIAAPTTTTPPFVPPPVKVAHDRELRGAWISTVFNGTWPSKAGLSQSAAQAELLAIFDALAAV